MTQPHRARQLVQPMHKPAPVRDVTSAPQAGVAKPQLAAQDPSRACPADILALQRAAGNRAVSGLIQAKLMVGAAADHYEQEADRVAERVLSMPVPGRRAEVSGGQPGVQRQMDEEEVQTKPLAATITPLAGGMITRQMDEEEVQTKPLVQRQMDEEEVQTKPLVQRQEDEEAAQTKPDSQRRADGAFEAGPRIQHRLSAMKGGGSPLPAEVRSYMEPRFGADFGDVRLHTDREAAQLSRDLSAQAFTHGQDIYLGASAPTPSSGPGIQLLAHELTHTIQQGRSTSQVARWGLGKGNKGTSHTQLTKEALPDLPPAVRDSFGTDALNYLAENADKMDSRVDYLLPVGIYMLKQAVGRGRKQGMYAGKALNKKLPKGMSLDDLAGYAEEEKKKRAEAYDQAMGYNRNPAEAPNHSEGGMYKAFGQGQIDLDRIERYMTAALGQWATGDPRQSMYTLSLALHTAQDIGAHGHGQPGMGHDPRRFWPPPNEYAKMAWVYNQYGAGKDPEMGTYGVDDFFAWCDNKEKNPDGWEMGKDETVRLLTEFDRRAGGHIGMYYKRPGLLTRWLKEGTRSKARLLGGRGIIKDNREREEFTRKHQPTVEVDVSL